MSDPLRPLLARFLVDGHGPSMERMVARTRPRLMRVARRIGSPQDAEDTVQATYHSLLRRGAVPDGPIEGWLTTAAIRIAYRKKATARRQRELADRLASPGPSRSPLDGASDRELARLVRRHVAALPGRYRDVLVLHHLEGLSTEETARLLGTQRSTVTTRLQRGRALLRSRLGPRLALGAFVLPWLLGDGWSWTAPAMAHGGTAMQAKSTVAVLSVGIAAGALGLTVGASQAKERRSGARAPTEREASHWRAEIEERDKRIESLHAELERVRAQPKPKSAPSRSKPGRRLTKEDMQRAVMQAAFTTRISMEDAKRSARRLGVTEVELELARDAFDAIRNDADPEVVAELRKRWNELGDRRTVVTAAFLRGVDASGAAAAMHMPKLVSWAHVPGEDARWIEALRDTATPGTTKLRLVEALSATKSDRVANYLYERLHRETDPYMFGSILRHLSDRKDTRAIPFAEKSMRNKDWAPHRVYWFYALARMGGEEAKRVLIEDARRRPLSDIDSLLDSIARLDRNAARDEAIRILDRESIDHLSKAMRAKIEQHAGR